MQRGEECTDLSGVDRPRRKNVLEGKLEVLGIEVLRSFDEFVQQWLERRLGVRFCVLVSEWNRHRERIESVGESEGRCDSELQCKSNLKIYMRINYLTRYIGIGRLEHPSTFNPARFASHTSSPTLNPAVCVLTTTIRLSTQSEETGEFCWNRGGGRRHGVISSNIGTHRQTWSPASRLPQFLTSFLTYNFPSISFWYSFSASKDASFIGHPMTRPLSSDFSGLGIT